MRMRLPTLCVMVLAALGAALPGASTTIVPAADPGELAMDSGAVFLARAGVSRVVKRPNFLATVTEFEVLRVIKGDTAVGDLIQVSAPGGMLDGVGWAVAGSPRFTEGEVYLLFSDRGPDASYRPRLMAESVLRRVIGDDGVPRFVPLQEAAQLKRQSARPTAGSLVPGAVDAAAFLEALAHRVEGTPGWDWSGIAIRPTETLTELKSVPSQCSFMEYENKNIRWSKFASGSSQAIYAEDDGDDHQSVDGFSQVEDAAQNWATLGDANINLYYGGKKNLGTNWCDSDHDEDSSDWDTPSSSANTVVFNDPCDDIPDLVNCGGTLAFGGPWFGATHTFDGTTWYTASGLFVIVNNGSGCTGSSDYEIMITHEVGHGLGFGHPSTFGDLMSENCCYNFSSDVDIPCAEYAYPPVAATTATPTRTPTRTPTPAGPTATPTRTPTPVGPTATPTPNPYGPSQVTVPVIVHKTGSNNTLWRSDLVMTNPNALQQRLRFEYQTDTKGTYSEVRSLGGYASLLYEDLAATLFGAGISSGPLTIEVTTANRMAPVVVSRAYAENNFGDLGSGLPADVEPSTDVVSMPGLYHDDNFRSSVSVTAGPDKNVWATFELYRGGVGQVAGGVQEKILAGTQSQWSIQQLFRDYARDGVPMTVRATLSNPGVVFASMTDNNSTDSAVYLGKEPDRNWIVPVVAYIPGKDDTFWISSVSLWNSSSRTAWVDLEYLPDRTNNSGGGMTAPSIRLDPYSTRTLNNVVRSQFGIDNGKGVLAIESSRPITVTSRVFTDGPKGGSSGNGVRTIPESELSSGEMVLPGVRLRKGYRTNIGVVTGDKGMTFDFDLRDANGALRASTTLFVPPRTLHQRSVENLFGSGFSLPNPVGAIVVNGNKPYTAYLTVIDPSSQDPVFVMPR